MCYPLMVIPCNRQVVRQVPQWIREDPKTSAKIWLQHAEDLLYIKMLLALMLFCFLSFIVTGMMLKFDEVWHIYIYICLNGLQTTNNILFCEVSGKTMTVQICVHHAINVLEEEGIKEQDISHITNKCYYFWSRLLHCDWSWQVVHSLPSCVWEPNVQRAMIATVHSIHTACSVTRGFCLDLRSEPVELLSMSELIAIGVSISRSKHL